MNRVLSALALSVVFVFTLAFGAAASRPAQAQDEMMTHVCDSSLITLLYIAEADYGFHAMEMDLASFEKGQYAPLFEAMMAEMMDEGEMMEEDMTEGEMMEEDMTEGEMMEDMVMLAPAVVEGEDEACTALRAELDTFFYDALTKDMMGMEMESEG